LWPIGSARGQHWAKRQGFVRLSEWEIQQNIKI